MKKILALFVFAISVSAYAQDMATVVNVQPRYITIQQQQCQQVPVREDNSGTGSVIGAVAGGIIGNQVGKGTGRDVATVGGAIIGGMVGNRIGTDQASTSVRTQCTYVPMQVQQGSVVTFNYRGHIFTQTFDR